MKRILLFTPVLLFSISVFSQINKGSVFLGGSLGVTRNTTDTSSANNSNSLYISPQIGIAIKNNSIFGLNLLYGHGENGPLFTNDSYGLGIFYRKYKQLGKSFYLFAHGQIGYSNYKSSNTYQANDINKMDQSIISFILYPGLSYEVSKNFHLEAAINNLLNITYSHTHYLSTNNNYGYDYTQNGYSISTSAGGTIPINIGFRFIFGNKNR